MELTIRGNDRLEADIKMLQRHFGTRGLAKTVRRAIAREVVLERAIDGHAEVIILGRGEPGTRVRFVE